MAGRLIVLEGPDGVGKTSLTESLRRDSHWSGSAVKWGSFPGREPGTLGGLVYAVHHDPSSHGLSSVHPAAVQALHIAAHIDAIHRWIRPTLDTGSTVILDRFWWSTWVYGTAAGMSASMLDNLIGAEREAWGDTRPSPLVLLRRDSPLRDDANTPDWRQLHDLYMHLAQRESAGYPIEVVANAGIFHDTLKAIIDAIMKYD